MSYPNLYTRKSSKRFGRSRKERKLDALAELLSEEDARDVVEFIGQKLRETELDDLLAYLYLKGI